MNGLDKITARIETEAVADAARLSEETAAQCAALRSEGEAKAQESYWRRVQTGVKAAEDRVQRLAKAADMEARKSILSAKQDIVAEAFRQAEEKLLSLPEEEYIAFLAGQAARAAVTGREELVLNAKDREALGTRVLTAANAQVMAAGKPGSLTLAAETGDFAGGVVVRSGNISVNCTVEALMAEARISMASETAAALFG